jgi:limonene-1,2-epoxide hydrolase
MINLTNEQLVTIFWQRLGTFDFDGAGELLHDDYLGEYPQTGERIRGRSNFVALNAEYPGRWAITIDRIVAAGADVVTEVTLRNSIDPHAAPVTAVSFFTIRDGKIYYERDFWPEPYAPPSDRAAWVERDV